jgi:hypothetical protein
MFLFCPMEFATNAVYSVRLKCAPTGLGLMTLIRPLAIAMAGRPRTARLSALVIFLTHARAVVLRGPIDEA